MEENQNRNVFALNGVTGMLIATVLLLSILVCLTWWGILVQQKVAQNPYELKNPQDLTMKVVDGQAKTQAHIVIKNKDK